ncbi:MAG: right-handed parallel beta-helix repeat-containing protein, partial [Planctomycetota bacterium]
MAAISDPGVTWRLRSGGDDTNGGGYLELGGADYSDQDAARESRTDWATADGTTTTITSAVGGLSSDLVGNVLRISAGSNFAPGYYLINSVPDANSLVLDRAPATDIGSGGVGKIGGSFSDYRIALSGNAAITSPLANGHRVLFRGSGTDSPTNADFVFSTFGTFATSGVLAQAAEPVEIGSYNGRALLERSSGTLVIHNNRNCRIHGLSFRSTGITHAVNGMVSGIGNAQIADCVFDANGFDVAGVNAVNSVTGCRFINSGGSPGALRAAIAGTHVAACGNRIEGWPGLGIKTTGIAALSNNLITGCGGAGIEMRPNSNNFSSAFYNTIVDCPVGVLLPIDGLSNATLIDNLISDCATAIEAQYNDGTVDVAEAILRAMSISRNAFHANGTNYSVAVSPPGDIQLSAIPYVDPGSGNYALNDVAGGGGELRAAGGANAYGATQSFRDIGAIQSQASGGG